MKLVRSTKSEIRKNKNGENVYDLKITDKHQSNVI